MCKKWKRHVHRARNCFVFSLSLCSFFDNLVAVVRSWLLHLCDRKLLLIDDANAEQKQRYKWKIWFIEWRKIRCNRTMWKYHIDGFDDNFSKQHYTCFQNGLWGVSVRMFSTVVTIVMRGIDLNWNYNKTRSRWYEILQTGKWTIK